VAEVTVDNFGTYARVPTLIAQRLRSETYESPALPLSYSATRFVLRSTRALSNEHPPRIPTVDNHGNSHVRFLDCDWLVGEGELPAPMTAIRASPAAIPNPRVLSCEEIAALLAACARASGRPFGYGDRRRHGRPGQHGTAHRR
jgi:hypothetical protein